MDRETKRTIAVGAIRVVAELLRRMVNAWNAGDYERVASIVPSPLLSSLARLEAEAKIDARFGADEGEER